MALDRIRCVCQYVRDHEAEFIEKVRAESSVRQEETAKTHRKQLARNERRIAELDRLFQKVYEDNAAGKLSDDRYEQLSAVYEQEQIALRKQNTTLQGELDAFRADTEKTSQFIALVRRYTNFEELTTPMLNEFIHRIYVHEADKSSGERRKKVTIYLNLIGDFDMSHMIIPPTPEELEAEEKRRKRRGRQREGNHRYEAKKKAKREAQQLQTASEELQQRKPPAEEPQRLGKEGLVSPEKNLPASISRYPNGNAL